MTEKRKNELTAYAKKIATLSKVAIIDRIIKMLPLLTTGALSYILFVAEENINIQEQETEDIEE